MSPRSDCTSATTRGSLPRSSICATSATPSSWSSTTKRRSTRPITCSTWDRERASPGGGGVAGAPPAELPKTPASLTGQYLSGALEIALPETRRRFDKTRVFRLRGARGNNLKNIDLALPVGLFVCVTGVSGSGKSTLINDTLYHAVARELYGSVHEPPAPESSQGLAFFYKAGSVDQSPIGRTPRSNPPTDTPLFTPIRELVPGV